MRQCYWRFPGLLDVFRSRRPPDAPPSVTAPELENHLASVIPASDKPCLVHSSVGGFGLRDKQGELLGGMAVAMWLLRTLRTCIGHEGTLCMPTHPNYKDDPGFMFDKSRLIFQYDANRTPSRVGLLTELFRRQKNSYRSLHPLSSLCANGPMAAQLISENLAVDEPLPHGLNSAYHKVCVAEGTVVGIGLSLIKSMTILHVAEELADQAWPVSDFFYRRRFEIADPHGSQQSIVVRERRPEFVRSLVLSQVHRDLLTEGILKQHHFQGIRIETAAAASVLQYFQDRQRKSTYPYLWPRVSRIYKTRQVDAIKTA